MPLHEDGPILSYGEPLEAARAAMVMIHGRGATAEDILSLAPMLEAPGIAYLAPQAANNTWYPYPFTQPIERNEPWLSSALARVGQMVALVEQAGIPADKTYLLGFSQGACLSLEYAARHARRYGGVFGLSGGLIGPDGTPRDYPGSMDNTPLFLGCSDVDFHIAKERVLESAEVFRRLGADVAVRLYPNMGHTINDDEIAFVRQIVAA
ncbi:MAG: alpha/beta hydrolase [Anaerolineae bacterium]|jgi:predicted esterase|nr:alpha/beta hydrolase [Anaerolineae bacterium]